MPSAIPNPLPKTLATDEPTFRRNWRPVSGIEFRLVQLAMFANLYGIALRLYRHPIQAWKAMKALLAHGKLVLAERHLSKGIAINGKYGWDMFHPLWPSPAFDRFFYHHFEEVMPSGRPIGVLRRLLVALTKKCPLQCAHCSEWDTLNQPDSLELDELQAKIETMLTYGVSQIVYSGGEPLNRFEDLCVLVQHFRQQSQWIYTSGYGLTLAKAQRLKAAGLEGVAISLDHHEGAAHDAFRGSGKSFQWVKRAIAHCQEAGLWVSVNVCPTKAYLAADGLPAYIQLMKQWQVPMINVLEPRAVGHFANQDVELNRAEKTYLEQLFYQYNFEKGYEADPILLYPAIARKHVPCGGGVSYLLLDYDGTLRPCPFCKTPMQMEGSRAAKCEA